MPSLTLARPPILAPAWLSPTKIAFLAALVGTAAVTLPILEPIREVGSEIGNSVAARLVVIATTTSLAALVLRLALRAKTADGAMLWSILGSGGAGILNAGLSLFFVRLLGHHSFEPGAVVVGSLLGGILGGPIGIAYGLAYLPVVVCAVNLERAPSHGGTYRTLAAAGGWLLLVGLGSMYFAMRGGVLLATFAAVLGACALGFVVAWGEVRRRWLRRVRSGTDACWRIVARDEGNNDRGILPLSHADAPDTCDAVLVHTAGRALPYRGGDVVEPVALVRRGSFR